MGRQFAANTKIHYSRDMLKEPMTTLKAIRFWSVALGVSVGVLAAPAIAQQDVSYKRKTVINFEDDTIEGDLKTPDQGYVEVRKKVRHRSLIRIRRDFRREVLGSIADL